MNKIITFLIAFFLYFNVFSQDTTGLNRIIRLVDKDMLILAKEEIDKEGLNKQNEQNPTYWLYRGVVYHGIYESHKESVKLLSDNPLMEAFNSYIKTKELDIEKTYISNVVTALGYVTNQFTKEGIDNFNNGKYKKALSYFESSIIINSLPEIMYTDTILFYNSALAAEKMKDYITAIKYYKKAIELKFGEGKVYIDLSKIYKQKGDIDTYLYTLKEGSAFFPKDIDLTNEIINHYISVSDINNTIIYTQKAIKQDSTVSNLYFILGSMYESNKTFEKAKTQYKKAISIDSTNTDAAYNLGVIYYNSGVDKLKHAKTKIDRKQAEYEYTRALIYITKVHKSEPKSKDVLYILRNIYRVTGNTEQKALIDAKLQELN